MKKLLFISLFMATMAWAGGVSFKRKPDLSFSVYELQSERCYDINMTYFNQCTDNVLVHLEFDEEGKVISVYVETQNKKLKRKLSMRLRHALIHPVVKDGKPTPAVGIVKIHIPYDKQPINNEATANKLRLICRSAKQCDMDELEDELALALQEKGL